MPTVEPFYRPNDRDERPGFAGALERTHGVRADIDKITVSDDYFPDLWVKYGEPANVINDESTRFTVVHWNAGKPNHYAAQIRGGYVIYSV